MAGPATTGQTQPGDPLRPPPSAPREGDFTFHFVRPPDRDYTFHSTLLAADHRHIVLTHEAFPSQPLHVDGEEVMGSGYTAVWFLFQGEPYDVARFYRPDGTWTGYYADVLEPVHWDGADPRTLQPLVDLFLDLWVTPEGRRLVLDEDEFGAAAANGVLSPQQVEQAQATLQALLTATARGDFPPEEVKSFHW